MQASNQCTFLFCTQFYDWSTLLWFLLNLDSYWNMSGKSSVMSRWCSEIHQHWNKICKVQIKARQNGSVFLFTIQNIGNYGAQILWPWRFHLGIDLRNCIWTNLLLTQTLYFISTVSLFRLIWTNIKKSFHKGCDHT
jgi:hypothetical protein